MNGIQAANVRFIPPPPGLSALLDRLKCDIRDATIVSVYRKERSTRNGFLLQKYQPQRIVSLENVSDPQELVEHKRAVRTHRDNVDYLAFLDLRIIPKYPIYYK